MPNSPPDTQETTEQSQPRVSPGLLAALATLGVGGAAYGMLRHKRLSSDPRLRAIQEASKGKFTRVLAGSAHDPTRLGRASAFMDRILWAGGGDIMHAPKLNKVKGMKIPGAVRHYTRTGDQFIKGDVNLSANTAARRAYDVFENNKWKEYQIFNKFAPGSMGPSEHLPAVLKRLGYDSVPTSPEAQRKMLGELQGHLKSQYTKGFYLKDVHSANTGGKFPTNTSNFLHLLDEARRDPDSDGASRVIHKLLRDPASAMVQERLPMERGSWLGRLWNRVRGDDSTSTKEVRVHVINGVVMPDMTVPRFDKPMNFTPSGRKHLSNANEHAHKWISALPNHLRDATFAMDVAPLKGGGYAMVESNPSGVSGLLAPKWNPRVGVQMHKAFTGQHSKPVAAMGAVGAGALAAAGTYGAAQHFGARAPEAADPVEGGDSPHPATFEFKPSRAI